MPRMICWSWPRPLHPVTLPTVLPVRNKYSHLIWRCCNRYLILKCVAHWLVGSCELRGDVEWINSFPFGGIPNVKWLLIQTRGFQKSLGSSQLGPHHTPNDQPGGEKKFRTILTWWSLYGTGYKLRNLHATWLVFGKVWPTLRHV